MTDINEEPGKALRTDNNNSSAAKQYEDEDHHEDGFAQFMGFMTSPVVQPDNVSASNGNNESGGIERGRPIPTNDNNDAPMPPAALQDSNDSAGVMPLILIYNMSMSMVLLSLVLQSTMKMKMQVQN